MPPEGTDKQERRGLLSLEELAEIVRTAVALGIRKIRLTGGEPLMRQGMLSLCREVADMPGVEELALTTNGLLLPSMAGALKEAGVHRVNVSVDTLCREKYAVITRGGRLEEVFRGLRAAWAAGLAPLKINCVLMGGFNDDEIPAFAALTEQAPVEVRFIELMPMGGAAAFAPEAYLSCAAVLERLPQLEPLTEDSSPTRRYRLPGAVGTVGLIRPLSNCFCSGCNRIRLTADGFIKPCLHSPEEISLRGLHGVALRQRFWEAVQAKPAAHGALSPWEHSLSRREMNQIGG